jgi:hypothetical protein
MFSGQIKNSIATNDEQGVYVLGLLSTLSQPYPVPTVPGPCSLSDWFSGHTKPHLCKASAGGVSVSGLHCQKQTALS